MVEAKRFTFDEAGVEATVALSEGIFAAPVNLDLLYRAVRTQLMNRRQGTSSTKTRGEVRGGGRKPWRQKGTGRARAGSRRSPLWVGGGTVFGPKPRTYNLKLTKKMWQRALVSALSDRAAESMVTLLDRADFECPSTKAAIALLARVGMPSSTLVVVGAEEYVHPVRKSFSNIPGVKCVTCRGLNVYDVLRYRGLLLTEAGMDELRERFES